MVRHWRHRRHGYKPGAAVDVQRSALGDAESGPWGRLGGGFELAVNRFSDSVLAGACFAPDGKTLFVNVFGDGTAGSGMTVSTRGPWGRGAL